MATINFPNGPRHTNLVGARSTLSDHGGPAKSNRFLVRVNRSAPDLGTINQDLSLLCEAAEFPGRGFMAVDNRYYGPNFKVPYQTSYEDLILTFIVRDDFLERQYFDNWMNDINPIDTYNFNYRNNYVSTIELFQLSDINGGTRSDTGDQIVKTQYAFTFDRAYPILVNPQPITWADDNFHRLTVTFTYSRWYRAGLDSITTPTISGNDFAITENYIPKPVDNNGNTLDEIMGNNRRDYGRYRNNVPNAYDNQMMQSENQTEPWR